MSNSIYKLSTKEKFKYNYYPYSSDSNQSGSVQFRVQAAHNAHIALSTQASKGGPLYEVVIGGWNNTKSVIRRNKETLSEASTPDILNDGNPRGFVIRWDSVSISVSQERTREEQEEEAFMSWDISEPLSIKYVGFSTGWGASGSWTIQPDQKNVSNPETSENWVEDSYGHVPQGAFYGGREHGERMYVIRVSTKPGIFIPGKLVKTQQVAYIPLGGKANPAERYEVLCDFSGEWLANSGDNIPPNALSAGESEDSPPHTLYIGRVFHEDDVIVGKFHPQHKVLYVAHKGLEVPFSDFEVLCSK